jgi:hypothetical protein
MSLAASWAESFPVPITASTTPFVAYEGSEIVSIDGAAWDRGDAEA